MLTFEYRGGVGGWIDMVLVRGIFIIWDKEEIFVVWDKGKYFHLFFLSVRNLLYVIAYSNFIY